MFRSSVRLFHISRVVRSGAKVGEKTLTNDELAKLLNSPTWKVKDLINNTQKDMNDIDVDSTVIRRMLKISGFHEDISSEKEVELIRALKLQMAFIKNLYDKDEKMVRSKTSNDSNFRLIATDHIPDEPITLKKLLSDIENLPHEVDVEKGEVESSFKITDLDPNNKTFFSIRTKEE